VLQQQPRGEMDTIDEAEAATSSISEDEEDPKEERVPDIVFLFGLKSDFANRLVETLQEERQDLWIEVLSYKQMAAILRLLSILGLGETTHACK